MEKLTRTKVLRILCLCVGCLMVAGSGPVLGFNVYAIPLKENLNLTQSNCKYLFSIDSRFTKYSSYKPIKAVERQSVVF